MPNTLGHLGAQLLLSRPFAARAELRWVALGCVVPDAPWIANRALAALAPGLDPFVFRAYWIAQASLALSLLLCAALASLAARPRRVFALLAGNALAHLLLDALETKWGNGVHLLAPFSWQMWNAELFWPESAASLGLSALGLVLGLACVAAALRAAPAPRASLRRSRVALSLAFLAAYLALPAACARAVIEADSHSLRTLREREARAGRPVAFDRVWLELRPAGAELSAMGGEVLRASGALPQRSGSVSARGRFSDPTHVVLDAVHLHGGLRRDLASYVGLALVAAIWLAAARAPRAPG